MTGGQDWAAEQIITYSANIRSYPDVPTEAELERQFVRYVERDIGGLALKLKPDGVRGFPDRAIYLPDGRHLLIELKRRDGKPSRQQLEWIEKFRSLGHTAEIVHSYVEATAEVILKMRES